MERPTVTLSAMLGLGLGEYRLHGRDVAKALDQPWPITPDDARLVLASALPLLPLLVDPSTTADVRAVLRPAGARWSAGRRRHP